MNCLAQHNFRFAAQRARRHHHKPRGKQKHAAFVYCEFHARKAYQPPQAMRRRDREPGNPGFVAMPVKKITAA